jgi:hypothetical protein
MTCGTSSFGYPVVSLRIDKGKRKQKAVHALVLEAFIGPCPKGMEACHFPDRNKTNCNLENLRWDTPKGNRADSVKHGTQVRGETTGTAVLTEKQVRDIRRRFANGENKTALAERFNAGWTTIARVVNNETWKHVN